MTITATPPIGDAAGLREGVAIKFNLPIGSLILLS
jgi:hypothetical protein